MNDPAIPLTHISYIIAHVRERIVLRVYSVDDAFVVSVLIVAVHDRGAIRENSNLARTVNYLTAIIHALDVRIAVVVLRLLDVRYTDGICIDGRDVLP